MPMSISIQRKKTIRNEREQKRTKQSYRLCELIWRTISRHVTITSSLASARIFSATFSFFVKLYKNKLRHSFLMATNRQSFLALLLFFAVSFFLRSSFAFSHRLLIINELSTQFDQQANACFFTLFVSTTSTQRGAPMRIQYGIDVS